MGPDNQCYRNLVTQIYFDKYNNIYSVVLNLKKNVSLLPCETGWLSKAFETHIFPFLYVFFFSFIWCSVLEIIFLYTQVLSNLPSGGTFYKLDQT